MVFFTCNACGASLKKNQVEKHYQTECPNCEVLSCMDCGKDFYGDEYASHTKCISEAEKYQGSMFSDSARGPGKGERKQQAWLEHVRQATSGSSVNPRVAGLLEKIADYPNVPRKRVKFENFVRNSFNVRDTKTLEQLWSVFDGAGKPSSTCNKTPEASSDALITDTPVHSRAKEETDPKLTDKEIKSKHKNKEAKENAVNGSADVASEEVCRPKKKKKLKKRSEEEDRETARAVATEDHPGAEEPDPVKCQKNEVRKTKKQKRPHGVDSVENGSTVTDSDVVTKGTSSDDLSKHVEEMVSTKKKKRHISESADKASVNKKPKLEHCVDSDEGAMETEDYPKQKHKKKHKHKRMDAERVC